MYDMKQNFNIYTTVSRLFNRFFAVFGLLVLSMSAIGLLLNRDHVMFCDQILWTGLFAFLVAAVFSATDFLVRKNVNLVAVRAVHFILSYLAFLVTYVVGGAARSYFSANTADTNRVFMIICMTFLFIGVYAVVGFVRLGAQAFIRRAENGRKHYESIYSGSNTKTN